MKFDKQKLEMQKWQNGVG